MVASIANQYPSKNCIVFHDQSSTFSFCTFFIFCHGYPPFASGWLSSAPDAVHVHQELNIGLGFTQGYEIWVFDSGTFSRAGDGGFINWAFEGCFTANGADVTFTKCWRRQLKIWMSSMRCIRKTAQYLSILQSFSTFFMFHNPLW